jgi:Bacteriophage Sf6, terminase small subunit-like
VRQKACSRHALRQPRQARHLKKGRKPTKWQTAQLAHLKDARFLEALANGATISSAVKSAGYARPTVYKWRAADVKFAAAWDDAIEEGTDLLEDEVLRRAKDGVEEPRFYEGEICGHVRKYSDTLAIFLLKARRPEKYSDKVTATRQKIRRVIVDHRGKSDNSDT